MIFALLVHLEITVPDAAVVDAYRLGKASNDIRPVIVKFTSKRWVKLLFSYLEKFKKQYLQLANDLTKAEREGKKELVRGITKTKTLKP